MILAREWMNKVLAILLVVTAVGVVAAGCGGKDVDNAADDAAHGHDHGDAEGPHGGVVAEVANGIHMEIVYFPAEGEAAFYLLREDMETTVVAGEPPVLNFKTADGPRQVIGAQTDAAIKADLGWVFVDPGLKSDHLHGQVVVCVEGKKHFVAIPEHDHETESGDDPAHGDGDGHDHDDADGSHDHDDHAHGENTISKTAWTESCEWFVELDVPEKGCAAAFAAHVTLLADFLPAESGSFLVAARSGPHTTEAGAGSPSRPGIFTPEIVFPETGEWTLTLTYDAGDLVDSIEWTVTVYEHGEAPAPAEDEAGLISFLKEAQWKTAFATCCAEVQEVAAGKEAVCVCGAAVLSEGSDRFVLVQKEGEAFEKRLVETGQASGSMIEITSGLETGERVVTEGGSAILQ